MAYKILPGSHFEQRLTERMKEVQFNPKASKLFKDDAEHILETLKKFLTLKYQRFLGDKGKEDGKYTCSVIAVVKLKISGKVLPLHDLLIGNDSKKMQGDCYVACVYNNQLFTLLLLPGNKVSAHDLYIQTKNHFERKNDVEITEEDFDIIKVPNNEIVLDVDQIIAIKNRKPEPVRGNDPKEYPYEIRADYRKAQPDYPSTFSHKELGKGSIINSNPGGANSTGVWENITVKFQNGKIKDFKDLKTKSWFLARGVKF